MFFGFNIDVLPAVYHRLRRHAPPLPRISTGISGVSRHFISRRADLARGLCLPLFYLGWSIFHGARAGDNPWMATGLEWQTASPPPKENFLETPVVDVGPYHYHAEGESPEAEHAGRQETQGRKP